MDFVLKYFAGSALLQMDLKPPNLKLCPQFEQEILEFSPKLIVEHLRHLNFIIKANI